MIRSLLYRWYTRHLTLERIEYLVSDQFLKSHEWADLRWDAIEYYGARCIACGCTPQEDGIRIHIDHYRPRRTHPWLALDKRNVAPLCHLCNWGKGNKRATDFRKQRGYWRHLWLAIKG